MKINIGQDGLKLIKRMMSKCEFNQRHYLLTECWEWQGANTGHKNQGSYGKIKVHGKVELTHRVMWSCYNGFLSSNRQIDHICRNTLCCNPYHLEQVTNQDNQRRKNIKMEEIIKQYNR